MQPHFVNLAQPRARTKKVRQKRQGQDMAAIEVREAATVVCLRRRADGSAAPARRHLRLEDYQFQPDWTEFTDVFSPANRTAAVDATAHNDNVKCIVLLGHLESSPDANERTLPALFPIFTETYTHIMRKQNIFVKENIEKKRKR